MRHDHRETTTTEGGGTSARTFAALWGGQLLSLAGSSAGSFALAMTTYSATKSTSALAATTAAAAMSGIYLAPLAGAISDRFPRRGVLLVGNIAAAGTAASLAWATVAWQGAAAWLPLVLALVALSGFINAVLSVTMAATVRLMRPEADLTRVNGTTSLIESLPTITGPALGALVYTSASPAAVVDLRGRPARHAGRPDNAGAGIHSVVVDAVRCGAQRFGAADERPADRDMAGTHTPGIPGHRLSNRLPWEISAILSAGWSR